MSQLSPAYGGGGGGAGFTLGSPNNLFGATAGDASETPLTVSAAANRAAAEGVRDAYFTANPTNLADYDADGNEALGIILYYTSGSDTLTTGQTRVSGSWQDSSSVVAIQGQSGNAASLAAVTTGNVPMKGASGEFEDSSILETDTLVEVGKRLRTQRGSIEIGQANRVSGFGALLKIESLVTGDTFVLPFQRYDTTSGSRRTQELSFSAPVDSVRQGDFSQTMPLSGQFTLDGSGLPSRVIFDFTLRCPPNGTLAGTRFQMTVQGETNPFFSYPSEARYEAGDGEDITAGADGLHEIDLTDSPIFLAADQSVVVDYIVDSGTVLGDGTTPYYAISVSASTDVDLARTSDIPENVTDLSDVTSSGSGEIITSTERTKLNGVAEDSTKGVIVQDEGAQVAATATTVNITGAGATATAEGDVVTINVAGGSGSVPIQDEGAEVVAAPTAINIVGDIATVTDVNGVATITFSGTPPPPQAQHTNYIDVTVDSNASSVDIANGVSSDDLNPTVTLETFTGNRYIQILQSEVHARFTSILLGGINQIGAFTINDGARNIGGQDYRQYVTTNLITDAFSGQSITMGGAS